MAASRTRRGLDLTGLMDESFADRFWSKVDPSGDCWEWTAHRKSRGYGQFTVRKGQFYGAHNVSFALVHGPIPPGKVICHRCDNPPCVNPDHLFLGTQVDNAVDMLAKDRGNRARGAAQASARLTEDDVRAIRQAEKGRRYLRDLAEKYGVSVRTIQQVRRGATWRHVS